MSDNGNLDAAKLRTDLKDSRKFSDYRPSKEYKRRKKNPQKNPQIIQD